MIDTERLEVVRTLSVERPQGIGTAPTHVSRHGRRLPAALGELGRGRGRGLRALGAKRVRSRRQDATRRRGHGARARRPHPRPRVATRASSSPRASRPRRAELFGEEAEEEAEEEVAREPGAREVEALAADRPRARRLLSDGGLRHPAEAEQAPTLVWITAKGLGVGPERRRARRGAARGHGLGDRRRARLTTASSTCPSTSSACRASLQVPVGPQAREADARARRARSARSTTRSRRRTRRSTADGPIEHVFYVVRENRTYDQILGDDPRGDGDPKLTLFGEDDHPERARAGPALPAARPRLRQLRGLDRRPLLDLGRRGLRLRGQELAPELRRARAALRLRRLLGHLAVAGLPLRPGREAGDLLLQLRRGDRRARCRSTTSTGRPRRPPRSSTKFANSDLGPLAPGPQLDPPAPCFSNDASSGGEQRDHDAGGLRLVAARRAPTR